MTDGDGPTDLSTGGVAPEGRLRQAWDLAPDPAVVLDQQGTVIAVNAAWRVAIEINEGDPLTCGIGANYLEVCDTATGIDSAREMGHALRAILAGDRAVYSSSYRAQTPEGLRTSVVRAVGLDAPEGRAALVVHEDTTLEVALESTVAAVEPMNPVLTTVAVAAEPADRPVKSVGDRPQRFPAGLVWVRFPDLARLRSTLGPFAVDRLRAALGLRAELVVGERGEVCRVGGDDLLAILLDPDSDLDEIREALATALARPERDGTLAVTSAMHIGQAHWDGTGSPTWGDLVGVAREAAEQVGHTEVVGPETTIGPPETHLSPDTRPSEAVALRRHPDATVLSVLLVEDNPGDVSLVRQTLSRSPKGEFAVAVAASLTEALSFLSAEPVDCVLLDLGLPDAHGTQALHRLRSAHPLVPVVVLTGRTEIGLGPSLIRSGAQDYLPKGDHGPDELARAVALAVERMRALTLERRMTALVAGTREMVLVVDDDHRVAYSSPAVAARLGRWSADLTGGRFEDHIAPDDRVLVRDAVDWTLEHDSAEPTRPIEQSIRLSDGTPFTVIIQDLTDDPSVRGVVIRLRDDSDRMAALHELEVERAIREVMALRSKEVVVFFRTDGTIAWASAAARSVFGIDPSTMVGRNGYELIDGRDRPAVIDQIDRLGGPEESATTEFRVTLPTGKTKWIEAIATDFTDDPAIGALVANMRDITDRRRGEEELRFRSEVLAAVGQPVVACDATSMITYWNGAAADTFGWTSEEVLGADIRSLLPLSAPGLGPRRSGGSGFRDGPWSGELSVRAKDGSDVAITATATPLWNQDGYAGYIAVATDISDRVAREEATAQLAAIVRASTDVIYSIDHDRRIATWNEGAEAVYGYAADEIIGQPVSILAPTSLHDEQRLLHDSVFEGRGIRSLYSIRRRADGTDFDTSISLSPVVDHSGKVLCIAAISRDISDQTAMLRELESKQAQLLDAQRTANLGSFELDLRTGEVSRSDELWRILGVAPGSLPSVDWSHVHPDDRPMCRSLFERVMEGDTDVAASYRIVRPDGEVRWVSARMSGTLSRTPHSVVGTILDVTSTKLYEQELEQIAFRDTLTGLPNRAGLERALVRAAANDGEGTMRVAMLGLDDFKSVNDSHGHAVGDEVLRRLAERLRSAAPSEELLARLGSDRFISVGPAPDGRHLADTLHTAIKAPVEANGTTFRLSACVGVTDWDPESSPEAAIRDADIALHTAKDRGSGRTVFFGEDLRREFLEGLRLEQALRDAVDAEAFELVYQPVLDLETGRALGFEALIRWQHPELGSVSPGRFIPLAERRGLIERIGSWTLHTALEQIARWDEVERTGPRPWIAVNLSANQLQSDDLVDTVADALEQAGVPAERLHLELTETAMMSDVMRSYTQLQGLRSLGVEIDIDDFGTGYSSLSQLRRMPVNTLKIDRSFVHGVVEDDQDRAIASMIVGLARELGKSVQAEGVETEQQLDVLRSLGCDRAQGFLWSPGIDPDTAREWLAEH